MAGKGQGMADGTPEDADGDRKIADADESNKRNARISHLIMGAGSVELNRSLLPAASRRQLFGGQ
jgi:hypothetical protein